MKIVEIYWRDSRMFIQQHGLDEKLEVCTIRSCGFLLKSTDREIVLVGDLVDDEFRRTIIIPRENIVNVYINGKHVKVNI